MRPVAKLADLPPYSYRGVPDVPAFPDDMPLIVFDGVCVMCTAFARFVAARDRQRRFRFSSAQSALGQALYRHYGLDHTELETFLLVADGRASAKMEALTGIMQRLGGIWGVAGILRILPRRLSDWLYDRIAHNRYRIFGRRDECIRPDESWRDRVIG